MSAEQDGEDLAELLGRGELTDTAYFAVVDERVESWVDREVLVRLDEGLTLGYPEVALLLAAAIAVLLLAALGVAL